MAERTGNGWCFVIISLHSNSVRQSKASGMAERTGNGKVRLYHLLPSTAAAPTCNTDSATVLFYVFNCLAVPHAAESTGSGCRVQQRHELVLWQVAAALCTDCSCASPVICSPHGSERL